MSLNDQYETDYHSAGDKLRKYAVKEILKQRRQCHSRIDDLLLSADGTVTVNFKKPFGKKQRPEPVKLHIHGVGAKINTIKMVSS